MELYTIGHSTLAFEEFCSLLHQYEVEQLVDIRRFPTSRKWPQFKRDYLERQFPKHGVKYHWLGDQLGGYRSGGYEAYMQSESFREGFARLLEIAREARTAVMCAEKLWFRCHRRYLADYLTEQGHRIIHILDAKRTYCHRSSGEAIEQEPD
jgi:uncharacterized protein (DUF488 family)